MSKERERIITKQKYKRSEQVRSLIENKKMNSMGKDRRDTEICNRALYANRFNDSEGVTSTKAEFK
jgi:hypothetical protein